MESKLQHQETTKVTQTKVEHQTEHGHKPEVTEFTAKAHAIEQKFKLKEILIFILVLALGMAAAWGINRAMKNNKDKTAEAPSENGIELPDYQTPTPGTNGEAETQNPVSETPVVSNPDKPAPKPAPISVSPKTFTNNELGFTFALPVGWDHATTESSAHEIVFYDQLNPGVISSVEVYTTSGGETLDSLMVQLSRSPSVKNIRKVTLGNREWIEFESTSQSFNRGILTMVGGKIYYVNGELSKPEFAGKLSFF